MAGWLQGLINQSMPLLTASVTLTPAQLKALNVTPVVLIPAPGPGYTILPKFVYYKYNFVSLAYTNVGGPLNINLGALNLFGIVGTAFLDQVVNMIIWTIDGITGAGARAAATVRDNIPLVATNAGGAFATGDGFLTIIVFYWILPCNL